MDVGGVLGGGMGGYVGERAVLMVGKKACRSSSSSSSSYEDAQAVTHDDEANEMNHYFLLIFTTKHLYSLTCLFVQTPLTLPVKKLKFLSVV